MYAQTTNTTYNPYKIIGEREIREQLNLPSGTTIYNPLPMVQPSPINLERYHQIQQLEKGVLFDDKEKDCLEKAVDAVGDAFLTAVFAVVIGGSK